MLMKRGGIAKLGRSSSSVHFDTICVVATKSAFACRAIARVFHAKVVTEKRRISMERKESNVSTSQLSKVKLDELVEIVTLNLKTDEEVDKLIDIVARFRQVTGIDAAIQETAAKTQEVAQFQEAMDEALAGIDQEKDPETYEQVESIWQDRMLKLLETVK